MHRPLRGLALHLTLFTTAWGQSCWSEGFTWELCCDLRFGPTGKSDCWSGEYTYASCCRPEENAKRLGNPICWDKDFDWDTCCHPSHGETGNKFCWSSLMDYKRCCPQRFRPNVATAVTSYDTDVITCPRVNCIHQYLSRQVDGRLSSASTLMLLSPSRHLLFKQLAGDPLECHGGGGAFFSLIVHTDLPVGGPFALYVCAPTCCSTKVVVEDLVPDLYGEHSKHFKEIIAIKVTGTFNLFRNLKPWRFPLLLAFATFAFGAYQFRTFQAIVAPFSGARSVTIVRMLLTLWLVIGHTITHTFYHTGWANWWYRVFDSTLVMTNHAFFALSAYCAFLSTWSSWRVAPPSVRARLLLRKAYSTWCRLVPPLLVYSAIIALGYPHLSLHGWAQHIHPGFRLPKPGMTQPWPRQALILPFLVEWFSHGPGRTHPASLNGTIAASYEMSMVCSVVVFAACCFPRHLQHGVAIALGILLSYSKWGWCRAYDSFPNTVALYAFCVAVFMDWCRQQKVKMFYPFLLRTLCICISILSFFFALRARNGIAIGMALSFLLSFLPSGQRPLGKWACLSRLCLPMNLLHTEIVLFYFIRIAFEDVLLEPFFCVAIAWILFILVFSILLSGFLCAVVILPMEHLLLKCSRFI